MSHTDRNLLQQKLSLAKTQIIPGTHYRHTKTGGEYLVIDIGINEKTEQISIIYQELNHPERLIWIRSLTGRDGWLTPTEIDGQTVPRFTKIN